jgi:hypothetical protein
VAQIWMQIPVKVAQFSKPINTEYRSVLKELNNSIVLLLVTDNKILTADCI